MSKGIKNGTSVTYDLTYAEDVLIENGKILETGMLPWAKQRTMRAMCHRLHRQRGTHAVARHKWMLRMALVFIFGMATTAHAAPLEWRDATRTLAFDNTSSMTLEFLIVDLPNGDQFRLTCQLDKGRKRPVFQVLLGSSDAQKAMVSLILGEGASQEQVDVGPLVYRSLEGIRAAAPEGILARMTQADWMMVKVNGGDWQNMNQESSAAVLPRLSCYKNN